MLTTMAVIVHGYHPYAEDGGLYLAGIKRILHPDLYPYWTGFTTAHLRFSLFAPLVALLVRISHLGLLSVLLVLYIGTIWATLFAAWQLAMRCFPLREQQYGAVSLLALLLTVPVAGTSLMLMDPYVSARSISTPCSLLALVAMIDVVHHIKNRQRTSRTMPFVGPVSLFLASVVHPLMAGYALGCILAFLMAALICPRQRWAAYASIYVGAIALAVLLFKFCASPDGYAAVALTRTYWFLDRWQWYEWLGLVIPLLVIAIARFRTRPPTEAITWLSEMCLIMGPLAMVVALLFAYPGISNYAVARLQPLRMFQMVYVITILIAGAAIGKHLLRKRLWHWTGAIATLAIGMSLVDLATFPDSAHLELPWIAPRNGWEQAFTWIRNNTPRTAVFALDADYITAGGEDAQNFRAIAERSALPDYSKDGGIASIAPGLTAEWIKGEKLQQGLDQVLDQKRLEALRAAGVNWVVLSASAHASPACDYANARVKVCRVAIDEPRRLDLISGRR